MNLFQIADDNAVSLASRFEDIKSRKPPEEAVVLAQFAQRVSEKGQVSINMRPSTAAEVLSGRPHQNIYEWAQEQADLSGRPVSEILREKLRELHDQRIAFDDAFDNGRQFRYGALNIGGVGATRYGQFCVVLTPEFPGKDKPIAYLRGDSLKTYMDSACKLDAAAIRQDAAPHSHRHCLAALKHADRLTGTVEDDWPGIVCSPSDCIEAIFLERPGNSDLNEIRILDSEYMILWDITYADYGRDLGDADRALGQVFTNIERAICDVGLPLRRL